MGGQEMEKGEDGKWDLEKARFGKMRAGERGI
jgi:hypothetical protein